MRGTTASGSRSKTMLEFMARLILRYLRCFVILILVFTAGLFLVYLIPNEALEPQYSKSIAQLDKEEVYANFLFSADGSIMDNFMDRLMVQTCHVSSAYESIIEAMLDNNGYPRYWNGYLLTLRPVLSQFTWQQIRYLNMFLLLTAFAYCFSGLHRCFNAVAAGGFAISVIACFLVLIGESLQYFSVFMILFAEILIILYLPRFRESTNAALLLFAAGMVTNYFDMLTAPLLTLGIPLLILVIFEMDNKGQSNSLPSLIRYIVYASVSWGFGYAGAWAAKWAIGTLGLGRNIFTDAMQTARFRVEGSEAYPLDRKLMLKLNFETYFFAKGHKPAIFLVLILVILLAVFIRHRKKDWGTRLICSLCIGIFPYIWFFVFANHSQLHYFYTFRIQAITLFSFFSALYCATDWESIRKPDFLSSKSNGKLHLSKTRN